MPSRSEDDGTRTFVEVEGLGVLSLAAFKLHGFAIANSLRRGSPGFVSDEYLNAISAATTVAVLELETAGIWKRCNDGYSILADDMVRRVMDLNALQGESAARPESGQPDPDQNLEP